MDVAGLLERIQQNPGFAGQLEHVEILEARAGRYAEPEQPMGEQLRKLLSASDIDRLYAHQAEALQAARDQRDLVVVTGTASGKTLCYQLPILEACLADGQPRAVRRP